MKNYYCYCLSSIEHCLIVLMETLTYQAWSTGSAIFHIHWTRAMKVLCLMKLAYKSFSQKCSRDLFDIVYKGRVQHCKKTEGARLKEYLPRKRKKVSRGIFEPFLAFPLKRLEGIFWICYQSKTQYCFIYRKLHICKDLSSRFLLVTRPLFWGLMSLMRFMKGSTKMSWY